MTTFDPLTFEPTGADERAAFNARLTSALWDRRGDIRDTIVQGLVPVLLFESDGDVGDAIRARGEDCGGGLYGISAAVAVEAFGPTSLVADLLDPQLSRWFVVEPRGIRAWRMDLDTMRSRLEDVDAHGRWWKPVAPAAPVLALEPA